MPTTRDEFAEVLSQTKEQDSVVRGLAAERLEEFPGPESSQALIVLLQDEDPVVRFKAACSLARLGSDQGAESLCWALRRVDLCFMSLEAMTDLGSAAVLEPLLQFFHRWRLHPLEKLQAAAALHRMGEAEGSDFLRQSLESPRPEERGFAIELWGRVAMPGALGFLQGIVDTEHDPHRVDAVRGLAHLRDRRALPTLERAARQREDSLLAQLAAEAMADIGAGPEG